MLHLSPQDIGRSDHDNMALADAAAPIAEMQQQENNRRLVRYWLYFVLAVLFVLFVVGGATRLTGSGLSITEWKPIHGVIPPLSEAEWMEEFDLYRQIPQYQEINRGMSLAEFQVIFWWEWAHRFLARAVGFVFAVPLAFFWVTGRLERHLKPKLAGILALGGLQGAVGWWMVSSGLVDRVDVSQYRLAAHMMIACLIFAATMLVARGLAVHTAPPSSDRMRLWAGLLLLAVLVQIYLGALVAGLKAGFAYNTWPLMDGALVPGGLFILDPALLNLFENPKTVQFVHRIGAYVLLGLALWHMIAARRDDPATPHARRALVLFHLILAQAVIGIVTLVMVVPLSWGLMHQGFALVVLGFAAAHWRGCKGAYPRPTEILVRG